MAAHSSLTKLSNHDFVSFFLLPELDYLSLELFDHLDQIYLLVIF